MAEEKKSAKPATGGVGITDSEATERIIGLLLLLLFLAAIISGLLSYFNSLNLTASGSLWSRMVGYFLEHIWPIWKLIAAIVSALALLGIIYSSRKLGVINREEQKIYGIAPAVSSSDEELLVEAKNDKWEQIIKYSNSDNSSDWRQAIIEADVMLEELLRALGYVGESVGEMLKSVDKSDFLTIEDAWDAHKTRNAIAHSGGNFQLNQHETKRTIALFENVFKEFDII